MILRERGRTLVRPRVAWGGFAASVSSLVLDRLLDREPRMAMV